jgi:hypothetical protein
MALKCWLGFTPIITRMREFLQFESENERCSVVGGSHNGSQGAQTRRRVRKGLRVITLSRNYPVAASVLGFIMDCCAVLSEDAFHMQRYVIPVRVAIVLVIVIFFESIDIRVQIKRSSGKSRRVAPAQ